MQKCCISFLYRVEFSTRWWKQHLDSTNSTPYNNSGSNIFGKKISISYWQSALYKISCSIYIYFFKYLYSIVWNIKTINLTLLCVISCRWVLESWPSSSNFTWKSLHAWFVVCVAFLLHDSSVLLCFYDIQWLNSPNI